jgi:uncharacterized LabA/DUF88 family protein
VRAFYYTAVTEDQEFSSVRPLLDWLDYNGFTVVTKPTKEFIDSNGDRLNQNFEGREPVKLCTPVQKHLHGGNLARRSRSRMS